MTDFIWLLFLLLIAWTQRCDGQGCSTNEFRCDYFSCVDRSCLGESTTVTLGRCRCQPNYVRSSAGSCVPQQQCGGSTSSGGSSVRAYPLQQPCISYPQITYPIMPSVMPTPQFPQTNTFGAQNPIDLGKEAMLYSLYHELNSDHLYTRYPHEVTSAIMAGYKFEGAVGRMPATPNNLPLPCPSLRRMQRFNKLGDDHFYTIWDNQGFNASHIGYVGEGDVGYCVFPGPDCGATLPLHRFYNIPHRDHLYTVNPIDVQNLRITPQWLYEGVECYLWV